MKRILLALLLLPGMASAQYLGDWAIDDTVRFTWNTFGGDGASITRATNGTISWHEDGSVTQSTAGVTDTEDFDSLTGVHLGAIAATAANGFENGKSYQVVLSAATIDGQTVNGSLGTFTIGKTKAAAAVEETTVLSVTSQTQLVLAADPGSNDWYNNFLVCIDDLSAGVTDCMFAIDYITATDTLVIERAAKFTVAVGDVVRVLPVPRNF